MEIPLATPTGIPPIWVSLDVVAADVPALLGLDVLYTHALLLDTFSNCLRKRIVLDKHGENDGKNEDVSIIDEWIVPLERYHGHIYAPFGFSTRTFFTRPELVKLHRQFAHPSTHKLYNLLKRARPEEATPETFRILEDLAKRCDPCQRIQNAPTRFRVSFGAENVRFNERLLIDIMYLDGKPLLHIVDEGTRFSAARFLSNVSTMNVWQTILDCWATLYTGLPRKILVDQGSQFGDLFISMAAASRVEVQRTGIESHNSLGLGERYHQPLRNTFRKLNVSYPNVDKQSLLNFSVKALNDTLGPEGLVPSALVFGEFPSTFTTLERRPPPATLQWRAELANMARKEMEKEMAKVRIRRGLSHSVPRSADTFFDEGDLVLVWKEKVVENRIGEWKGPYRVQGFEKEKKLVFVKETEGGSPRPFNMSQVKK